MKSEPIQATDRALTRRQAADICGYSQQTLANLMVLREGPPVRKHRRKCLYLESELLAWLRSLPVVVGGK